MAGVANIITAPLWAQRGLSAGAKGMLEKYSDLGVPLAGLERKGMITYVEDNAANIAIRDYETVYSLAGVNAYIDYVNAKVATNIANAPHILNGIQTDGATQYVNTNFVPSVDSLKSSQNNIISGSFIYSHVHVDGAAVYGAASASSLDLLTNTLSITKYRANQASLRQSAVAITDKSSWYIARSSILNTVLIKDDIEVDNYTGIVSAGLPTVPIYVGAKRYYAGVNGYFTGVQSGFMISRFTGFNKVTNNTNYRNLLLTLGLTI